MMVSNTVQDTHLLVSQAVFTPESLSSMQTEVIFEEYGFASLYMTSAPNLTLYNYKLSPLIDKEVAESPCSIVVDTGYSFSHVIPFFGLQPINHAIKR